MALGGTSWPLHILSPNDTHALPGGSILQTLPKLPPQHPVHMSHQGLGSEGLPWAIIYLCSHIITQDGQNLHGRTAGLSLV